MKPFLDTLRGIAEGSALDELTDEQSALIMEVRETQQAAELTLTVRYTPLSLDQVRVSYEVKAKRPKRPREESLFFFGEEGLQRDNPKQGKLDIDPDAPTRSAPADIDAAEGATV